ncbi:xanthine dehydrogenase family protein molybdopterin-binding subunit [Methylobacterium sp. WL64]|nr:xanthine dehydrogenase family protein molybdopterin-binding subunit [Methylobacterium sp. WL64]
MTINSTVSQAAQAVIGKVIALAPDALMPANRPDPLLRRQHGHVGKPISRLDGAYKVKGTAKFAAEFAFDGMTYAALAFSTVPKGRIASLDTAEAEAAPGVALVMTHRNAPTLKPMPFFMQQPKAAAGDSLPIMQDDRVHWNGQPIAVVLAETQEQADHATSLIRATYETEAAVTTFEAAKAAGLHPASFAGEPLKAEAGDAEAALAASPVKVDLTYRTPRHNHNAMELHAVTLAWEGDRLRIHDATQCVSHTAWSLAHAFGIEEGQVHVTSPYVGGGFGGKTLWQHHVLAAAAAKLAGRPVRLVLSREGVYRMVGGRTVTEQRVALGATAEGRLEALIHTGVVAMTDNNNMPEPFIKPSMSVYAARTRKLSVQTAHMDMLANTFMRAPGESVGSFALESAVDELAETLGMDPIALRLLNEPEKDPSKGTEFSSRHLAEAYRAGAERFGWNGRASTPGSRREGEWLVGVGMATATYPYQRMPGGAARITLGKDGRATIGIAAHEMGMGTATAQTQVAADRLGVDIEQIAFTYGDSSLPGTVLAGGSQQTASIGLSVRLAHDALVAELLKLAGNDSPLAGLSADDVEGRDGGLGKIDDPACFETYVSILARANRNEVVGEGQAGLPTELMHWSMHSYGAMFCEARVNAVTGETRVSRFLGSFDCGRVLNPKTARSQFRGGIIMGLGLALMEETQFDERYGRVMNPSLTEYHMPVHSDVPEIEVIWTDVPDPHAPMGAHGIGEIGITGVGAAVANAVYNATGKRVRDLPITLDKLM